MPIYEYKCSKCNSKFERRCSFSESDKKVFCPNCKSPASKMLSAFAALSKSADGSSAPIAGGGSCGPSCPGTSCASCHH